MKNGFSFNFRIIYPFQSKSPKLEISFWVQFSNFWTEEKWKFFLAGEFLDFALKLLPPKVNRSVTIKTHIRSSASLNRREFQFQWSGDLSPMSPTPGHHSFSQFYFFILKKKKRKMRKLRKEELAPLEQYQICLLSPSAQHPNGTKSLPFSPLFCCVPTIRKIFQFSLIFSCFFHFLKESELQVVENCRELWEKCCVVSISISNHSKYSLM